MNKETEDYIGKSYTEEISCMKSVPYNCNLQFILKYHSLKLKATHSNMKQTLCN
jgi:hypothetical protein